MSEITFDELLRLAKAGSQEHLRMLSDLVKSEQLPPDRMAQAVEVLKSVDADIPTPIPS